MAPVNRAGDIPDALSTSSLNELSLARHLWSLSGASDLMLMCVYQSNILTRSPRQADDESQNKSGHEEARQPEKTSFVQCLSPKYEATFGRIAP